MTTSDNLLQVRKLLTLGVIAGLVMTAGCESSSRSLTGPSASKCELSIPASAPPLGPAGGTGALVVAAARECLWSATTPTPWITIAEGSGQGDGVIRYNVAANPAPSHRQGALIVGDHRTEIVQEGARCVFAVAPNAYAVAAAGGDFPVTVQTSEECAWTAVEDVPWVDFAGPSSVTGSGAVRFRVEPNTGGDRSATLSIAGQTVLVEQAGATSGCRSTISPTDVSVPAGGGSAGVNVAASSGCPWTAASHATWIAVTSGAGGSGPGSVALSVLPNPGLARTGTVLIAGRTFTVVQAGSPAPCSYGLSQTAHSVGAAGGVASVDVRAGAECPWTATSHAGWITVIGGANGRGDGTVTLSIGANLGGERVGTVAIGDKVYTVTQTGVAACAYSLSPAAHTVDAAGGPVSFDVLASGACGWTAASQVSWMTVTSGASGSGAGIVTVSISANPGMPRVGTIAIADRVFTVTQGAADAVCSYSVTPTMQTAPLAPLGPFTATVDTQPGCAWTATSGASWIVITAGSSGTGGGTVTYRVGISLFTRTGTITVASETLTVHQGGLLLSEEP